MFPIETGRQIININQTCWCQDGLASAPRWLAQTCPTTFELSKIQKNPRVRKISVRNSGAGNGCAKFMDAWKKSVLSAGKTMSIKFLVLGGVFWVLGGRGGSADFIFMGARIFLTLLSATTASCSPAFWCLHLVVSPVWLVFHDPWA